MSSQYSSHWFQELQADSQRSASQVVPLLLELLTPTKVIDVGCGTGDWLAVFQKYGVDEVWGIDGAYVDQALLSIPAERFLVRDLAEPFQVADRFDLVLSLEVAEHLPPSSAGTFVESLTHLGAVILFSAAVPGQRGNGHINGQWPAYWVQHFQQHGYVVIDCLRRRFWNNEQVAWWYSQNMLLFVKSAELEYRPALQKELRQNDLFMLPLVHPGMFFAQQYDPKTIRLKGALSSVKAGLLNSIAARMKRS